MGWFDDVGDFIYPPKVGGDPVSVRIMDTQRVNSEDPSKCYKKLVNGVSVSYGYGHYFQLGDGRNMLCTTWKLFFALRDSDCRPGDLIRIEHPAKGVYKVTIISDSSPDKSKVKSLVGETIEEIGKRNSEEW